MEACDEDSVVADSDKTLSEVKQKLRQLRDSLYDPEKLKELFDVSKAREEVRKTIYAKQSSEGNRTLNEDIESCLAEIRMFDAQLKHKSSEAKAARLSRMHGEEETRVSLKQMHCTNNSDLADAVRTNSEQFMKLVCGAQPCSGPESTASGDGKTKNRNDKRKSKPKKGTFIERNIQLAKCGNGVLSLTDEEKLRLENLLRDISEGDVKSEVSRWDSTACSSLPDDDSGVELSGDNLYVCTDEAKAVLAEIDAKLQVYDRAKKFDYFPELRQGFIEDSASVVDKTDSGQHEEPTSDGKEKHSQLKTEACRLKELDKLLLGMATITEQEIKPLSEGELKILLEESEHYSQVLGSGGGTGGGGLTGPCPDDIHRLVASARVLMPNFKYRFE